MSTAAVSISAAHAPDLEHLRHVIEQSGLAHTRALREWRAVCATTFRTHTLQHRAEMRAEREAAAAYLVHLDAQCAFIAAVEAREAARAS